MVYATEPDRMSNKQKSIEKYMLPESEVFEKGEQHLFAQRDSM